MIRPFCLLAATVLLLSVALAQVPAPAAPSSSGVSAPAAPHSASSTLAAPGDAEPEEGASVSLTRKAKDGKARIIKIVRTGLTDDTGIFAACSPQDSDPEDSPTISVFSETGQGGILVTVDKNLIRAPLAVVTQKGGEGGGDGHIEMSAGNAKFLDEPPPGKTDRLSRCAVEASPKPSPDTVFMQQGRTHLKGQSVVYDETDGVARVAGPITFERAPSEGKAETERLTGTSNSIEINVDKESTTLVGDVVLKNGERTSTAARVDYDDNANVAILRGTAQQPAKSVQGKDILYSCALRYNLERNTVQAEGCLAGSEFDDSGDSDVTPTPSSAASTAPATPSK